jgi:uncharacterized RDD family membrane protein YckC
MTESTSIENLKQIDKTRFASNGNRIGAYLTDGIILMIVILPINYLNITSFKSLSIYLIVAILGILYKPLTEHYFGATIGKYALDLKVTDLNFNQISLKQSFLRSSILLIAPVLLIPIQYLAFQNPEIMSIDSFTDYSQAIANNYPLQSLITNLSIVILVIDLIFMLTDKEKLFRSLHDRIGKTYVVKTK